MDNNIPEQISYQLQRRKTFNRQSTIRFQDEYKLELHQGKDILSNSQEIILDEKRT